MFQQALLHYNTVTLMFPFIISSKLQRSMLEIKPANTTEQQYLPVVKGSVFNIISAK